MKRTVMFFLVIFASLGVFLSAGCGGGGSSRANILFVDDDNGMNNRGIPIAMEVFSCPDVDQVYTGDLGALGKKYKVHRVMGSSDGPDLDTLQKYEVVIWSTGESYNGDSAAPITLTLADQANLAAYLQSGGKLFLSSQDVIYDLMDGDESGTVTSAFINSYLGVLDAIDAGADVPTTYGVSGDPISDGMVLIGSAAANTEYINGFSSSSLLGSETGIFQYDSLNATALTLVADMSSGFASTVFNGQYSVDELTDETLSFDGRSFWAYTDGAVSVVEFWYEPLGINHFAALDLTGEPYFYNEFDGIFYDAYQDSLNASNPFPANADTLLVDINGKAVATRVEQDPWKVIFLAFPYEGLGPDSDRRDFLKAALDWLGE